MKRRQFFYTVGLESALMLAAKSNLLATSQTPQSGNDNGLDVRWLEGCTCKVVCPCITGKFAAMCHGIIANEIKSGVFQGTSLAAAKFVWVGHVGEWSYLYIDAPQPQREATTALARRSSTRARLARLNASETSRLK